MPRVNWKPAEELTAFARMIREGYMWQQTPPMSMTDFAEFAGVSRQAVFGWLNHRVLPKRDSVIAVAKVTGLDVDELLRAAGLPDSQTDLAERKRVSADYSEFMRLIDGELRARGKSSIKRREMREILREIAPRIIEKASASADADDSVSGEEGADTGAVQRHRPANDDDDESNAHRRRIAVAARR